MVVSKCPSVNKERVCVAGQAGVVGDFGASAGTDVWLEQLASGPLFVVGSKSWLTLRLSCMHADTSLTHLATLLLWSETDANKELA